MSKEFNEWWDDNVFVKDNPFRNDSPAFWAWEGWHAGVASTREACAKVCENIYTGEEACGDWPTPEMCAEAIRARGKDD